MKPQLDTRALMRVSNTAVNMVLWPPREWPMQPIFWPSTSGSVSSRSMAHMLLKTAFIVPLTKGLFLKS